MVTGPTNNILRQSSNNSNITNTLGQNAEQLFLEHPEPTDPVSQIARANEKLARKTWDLQSSIQKYAHLQW